MAKISLLITSTHVRGTMTIWHTCSKPSKSCSTLLKYDQPLAGLKNHSSNKMSYSSEEPDYNITRLNSPDISNEIQNAQDVFAPSKSPIAQNTDRELPKCIDRYMSTYHNFISWKTQRRATSISENVLLTYFHELSTKYKPPTLWSIYSMLRITLKTKNDIDIKKYMKLIPLVKRYNYGFERPKTKLLTAEHVERFLNEAPDEKYLLTKVILIFGIIGACKLQELADVKLNDIENHGELLLVKIPVSKTITPRTFIIQGQYYKIVKKYEALRLSQAKSSRFFQNYQRGKCTNQVVGVNKIGKIPKQIARFLKLPDSEAYTGHSFRKTSASLLPNKRTRTRRNIPRSSGVTNNVKTFESIFVSGFDESGASVCHDEMQSTRQCPAVPFENVTGTSVYEKDEPCDISINDQSHMIQLPKQQITFNFNNCSNITISLHS